MEQATYNVRLKVTDPSDSNSKCLFGCDGFPDIGGTPERIDVTNFSDKVRRYIDGVQDGSEMNFTFFANSNATYDIYSGETYIYNSLKKLSDWESAGTQIPFTLELGTIGSVSFIAIPKIVITGGGVNEAIKFTLTTTPIGEITKNFT